MKNADTKLATKEEIFQKMNESVKNGDTEAFSQAYIELAQNIQDSVLQEAQKSQVTTSDDMILSQRGNRVLTSEEKKYYESAISAMKASNPKQALAEMEVVLPLTVIDNVFDNMKQEHELLEFIDFQNASALTEIIFNTAPRQLATWSPLCAEIVKELTGGFKKIQLGQNKLSAFLPVCKAMLDLGPVWLDRYVRTLLQEALYFGLEDGIINGTGHEMPIGMNRDLSGSIDPSTGYSVKATTPITKLDPETYGELISTMAKDENGNARPVTEVVLIVNPVDYFKKVMPATTVMGLDNRYINNVLPFPTRIIQSSVLEEGKAILGLKGQYFMGIGTAKNGKIEYSDDYRFLEDERVYLIKLYGHGQPKDNNSFLHLDITGLVPNIPKVEVVGGGSGGTRMAAFDTSNPVFLEMQAAIKTLQEQLAVQEETSEEVPEDKTEEKTDKSKK